MTKKIFTIIFGLIISVTLIVFSGYCLQEYAIYHMTKDIMYFSMTIITLITVVTSLVIGGKKHEKN